MVGIRGLDMLKSGFQFQPLEPLKCLQLIPDRTVRNYSAEILTKQMAEFYQSWFERKGKTPADRFIFRTVYRADKIEYFLLIPKRLQSLFQQKSLAVWENATIKPVLVNISLDATKCYALELQYRRHNIFSLKTDKDENDPLQSLISVTSEMMPGDIAVIDSIFQPYSRIQWEYDSGKAYETFSRGQMPFVMPRDRKGFLRLAGSKVNGMMQEFQKGIISTVGGDARNTIQVIDPEREAINQTGIKSDKLHGDVLKTNIRIISQANDKRRALLTCKAFAGSYKDLTNTNELLPKVANPAKVLADMQDGRPPLISGMLFSTKEAAKLCQLPTGGLQEQFPQIYSNPNRELIFPSELFADVPGINIGHVSVRGEDKLARLPVVPYDDTPLKLVYDNLCTPWLITGGMGVGKTGGVCGNTVHGFLLNGLSAFLIDTADGQVLRDIEDSLPEDFPNDHIIHLDLDNKHYPVPLNWADVASRDLSQAQDELEAIELSERLTNTLIDYINRQSEPLSERMTQFLTSVARAVLQDPTKSLLDIELALKSPAYREELIQRGGLVPEILDDLNFLQEKAADGKEGQYTEYILSRLKIFSNSNSKQNLFYQPNKTRDDGQPLLNFRELADGDNSKYGYLIAIHASYDAWRGDQELLLSFIQDKIFMNIYSRVDQAQDQRKPCLNIVDEPHKFINRSWHLYENAAVEMRKYRLKLVWLGHYLSQMGKAAKAINAGGAMYSQYKTEDLSQFKELGHAFQPYSAEELYKTLPEKFTAVNKIKLPGVDHCPPFIAKMAKPPEIVKDRSARREQCAKVYGRHWKEVTEEIRAKRLHYQELDEKWREAIEVAKKAAKDLEKEIKKKKTGK